MRPCSLANASPFGEKIAPTVGPRHRVAHAHDVDARDALANVGVDALQVVQDRFFPVAPVAAQEQSPVLSWRALRKRPVEGPDRSVDVGAQASGAWHPHSPASASP